MAAENKFLPFIPIFLVLSTYCYVCSVGLQRIVGDSVWTIPPYNDFYTNWSSSYSFQPGDTLYFEFVTEHQNVMQVSRREYESCTADQAFKAFEEGPAIVPLLEEGVFYYICSVPDHCSLGQKINVTVYRATPYSTPYPPPTPPSPPHRPPTTPPAMSPYASQAPNAMEWSISLLDLTSSCDGYRGLFGWFASMCLVLYVFVV